jgi:hypothetical protein
MAEAAGEQALFDAIAIMGKGVLEPTRLELLDLLAQAPRTVDELAKASGRRRATTSAPRLRAVDRDAKRLDVGWPEWRLAGLAPEDTRAA